MINAKRWAGLGLALLLLTARPAAGYRVFEENDTETLAVEARLIVDATAESNWEEAVARYSSKAPITRFKVNAILNGPTAVPPAIDGVEPRDALPAPPPVAVGDSIDVAGTFAKPASRLMLFLSHRSERTPGPSVWNETSAPWVLPPNRLRVLHDGKSYTRLPRLPATRQAISVFEDPYKDYPPLAIEELERRIRDAIAAAPAMRASIDNANREDVPRLLQVCAARQAPLEGEPVRGEHWRRAAAARIDLVVDPVTAADFFERPPPGYRTGSALYVRPDGRAELLRRMESGLTPAGVRRDAADKLADGGRYYAGDLRRAAPENPQPHDGRYLQRVVALAIAAKDEEEARLLLDVIDSALPSEAKFSFPALEVDATAAIEMLAKATPAMSAERRFRAFEQLAVVAPATLRRVAPATGPFLSWLRVRAEAGAGAGAEPTRRLKFTYEWRNFLPKAAPPATLWLVFRDATTGAERERPIDSTPAGYRQDDRRGQFGGAVMVDAELSPDYAGKRYEVFIRARRGDDLLGDGVACVVDVR